MSDASVFICCIAVSGTYVSKDLQCWLRTLPYGMRAKCKVGCNTCIYQQLSGASLNARSCVYQLYHIMLLFLSSHVAYLSVFAEGLHRCRLGKFTLCLLTHVSVIFFSVGQLTMPGMMCISYPCTHILYLFAGVANCNHTCKQYASFGWASCMSEMY